MFDLTGPFLSPWSNDACLRAATCHEEMVVSFVLSCWLNFSVCEFLDGYSIFFRQQHVQ
jgi:hypothetical protein